MTENDFAPSLPAVIGGATADVKADFGSAASSYFEEGKARLTGLIGEIEAVIRDVAIKLESPDSLPISGYIHTAADTVSRWSTVVESKSIDELAADAKALVRAHPRTATAVALIGGFALVRLFRS